MLQGLRICPPLPEILYDDFDEDAGSDDSSDIGGAKSKAPISLKETEFFLKQLGKKIEQHNISAFNMWMEA
jgi:hypothetical protein